MNTLTHSDTDLFDSQQSDDDTHLPFLTQSQQIVEKQLQQMMHLKMMDVKGAIQPRLNPLIIGASGTGKTGIVKRFCEKHQLELFTASIGTWIVVGAKVDNYTAPMIARFVETHDSGVIFIDEIDKLTARHATESAWVGAIAQEIFAMLDADQRLLAMGFEETSIRKLKSKFMLVGAGAFQAGWQASRQISMGFDRTPESPSVDEIIKSGGIPEEILFRFAEKPLVICNPTFDDCRRAIVRIHLDANQAVPNQAELERLASEATQSNRGMRWLENYSMQILSERIAPDEDWRVEPAIPTPDRRGRYQQQKGLFPKRMNKCLSDHINTRLLEVVVAASKIEIDGLAHEQICFSPAIDRTILMTAAEVKKHALAVMASIPNLNYDVHLLRFSELSLRKIWRSLADKRLGKPARHPLHTGCRILLALLGIADGMVVRAVSSGALSLPPEIPDFLSTVEGEEAAAQSEKIITQMDKALAQKKSGGIQS